MRDEEVVVDTSALPPYAGKAKSTGLPHTVEPLGKNCMRVQNHNYVRDSRSRIGAV